MSKELILLCGMPGCGKTTWANNFCKTHDSAFHNSRDKIRFEILNDEDEYFSKENEVFTKWIKEGQKALNDKNYDYVIMDATHLNSASRYKTLSKLKWNGIIRFVYFYTPLNICFDRNNARKGRRRVPEDVMISMYNSYNYPTIGEINMITPSLSNKFIFTRIEGFKED